jgi:hypothetical protein
MTGCPRSQSFIRRGDTAWRQLIDRSHQRARTAKSSDHVDRDRYPPVSDSQNRRLEPDKADVPLQNVGIGNLRA